MPLIKAHEPCPDCGSSDALSVYDNGTHCFSCNKSTRDPSAPQDKVERIMNYQLPSLQNNAINSRGINRDIAARYGVGAHNGVLYMPYYSGGVAVGAKTLRPGKQFGWEGNKEDVTLFGVQCANGTKHIIITEGELDALAACQMTGYSAVSVPFGAQSAEKHIKKSLRWLENFDNVYICFDNDETGQKAAKQVLDILKVGKTKLVSLPLGFKDANELLLAGAVDAFKKAIWSAQAIIPSGICESQDAIQKALEFITNRDKLLGIDTGFSGLNELIGGFREGSITTLVSGTGCGKSTFARQLGYNLSSKGTPIFFVPLEQTVAHTATLFAQLELRRDVIHNPEVDKVQVTEALTKVLENTHIYDHIGDLTLEKLGQVIEYAVRAHDIKMVVLDHLNAAVTGGETDERRAIDNFMARLKELSIQHRLHIVVVCHQSRDTGDKQDNKPSLSRIRGSAGVAQYSDCVLGLYRDRDSNVVTVETLKADRLWGKYGDFNITYDKETTCFETSRGLEDSEPNWTAETDEELDGTTNSLEGETDERSQSDDGPGGIQEQSGTGGSYVEQRPVIRAILDSVPGSSTEIHPGLHSSERDTSGSQGLPEARGQEENEVSEGAEPSPGHPNSVHQEPQSREERVGASEYHRACYEDKKRKAYPKNAGGEVVHQ